MSGGRPSAQWTTVDEGWGRRAAEFASLSEPSNCREYVALHSALEIRPGDRLLDVACGAGLAVELARARGAICAGLDASERLVAVARHRTPDADLRVGDMNALPWDEGSFDVVTSFRGIWGTTPDAVAEVHRVLAPGGRIGITVWGHIKKSPGAWSLAPFALAAKPKVENQAAMVALGRPGVGEELLTRCGFEDVTRVDIPFAWEFPDPETYARALASTGPAYEAVQAVGEEAFLAQAEELARAHVRDGLPIRAEIAVVGYLARKKVRHRAAPATGQQAAPDPSGSFLSEPPVSAEAQALYDDDMAELGYVMNASRVWAHRPALQTGLFDLLREASRCAALSVRQRGILVAACASSINDSYCSLAWGQKLADAAGAELAAGVLAGDDAALDDSERALAGWARSVALDPNAATAADVQALRNAGYDDSQILAITLFISLRVAFSKVNDALGAEPDAELAKSVPPSVRAVVSFGRLPAGEA